MSGDNGSMMIQNHFKEQEMYSSIICTHHSIKQQTSKTRCFLIKEHHLSLSVNGQILHNFVCSPNQIAELCVGWLYDEGYLDTIDDLVSLDISKNGHIANANISDVSKRPLKAFETFREINPTIYSGAVMKLLDEKTTYSKTHGTHGCVFWGNIGGAQLHEDIGRYNAADKAIGAALLRGEDFSQSMLFSSGRVPMGMVNKSIRAGIPILISKATATEDAIKMARKCRLALLFSSGIDSFVCYEEII